MFSLCLWLACILVLPGLSSEEEIVAPKAVFANTRFDFEQVIAGAIVERDFVVKNEGSAPLRIVKVSMTPPLLATRIPRDVAPGTEGVIHFKLDTSTLVGRFQGRIVVFLDDPALPEADLNLEGLVIPSVELVPLPAFFVSALRGQTNQSSIEIINHEAEPLRIEGIEHSSRRFTTDLETIEKGHRYRLTLTLKADGPAGRGTDEIAVKTSSKRIPMLEVAANTYLHERVYTFPDEVDLGALRIGDIERNPALLQATAQTLMIYLEGGSNFQVKLKTDLPAVDLKWERGPKGDRYQATVALIRDNPPKGRLPGLHPH